MTCKVTIPTINTNDESAKLLTWHVKHGDTVDEGTLIALLETSKATYDLHAPCGGVIGLRAEPGREYRYGHEIAIIGESLAALDRGSPTPVASPSEASGELTISRRARERMAARGVSVEELASLGRKLIRERDVEDAFHRRTTASTSSLSLSKHQAAIAEVVTRSHREIPTSFTLMKIDCTAALKALDAIATREGIFVGVTELLLLLMAKHAGEFPTMFGSWASGGEFVPSEESDIGVTMDLGKGLYIPIVRAVRGKSIVSIAKELMRLRMKALKGKFAAEELAGGAISLSLNADDGTVFTIPIIQPPQSCMVSLGATFDEVISRGGRYESRNVLHLGLAYDHRIINGAEAVRFLRTLRSSFEEANPEDWA